MAATWPLPANTVEYATVQYTFLDQRSVFPTDLGRPKAAALATGAQAVITFDVILTATELNTFRSWWTSELALGAETFTGLEGVIADNQQEMQFKEIPRFVMIRSGLQSARLWRATFEMWVV